MVKLDFYKSTVIKKERGRILLPVVPFSLQLYRLSTNKNEFT